MTVSTRTWRAAALAVLTLLSLGDTRFARLDAQQQAIDPALLNAYRWRSIGPDRGGRSIAVTRREGPPARGVLRRRRRRALEDHRRRQQLGAGHRRTDHELVGRRRRGVGVEPRHRLHRHGRDLHPRQHHAGRRRLQIRPTPARRGRTSASATSMRSRRSASTRPTPTSSTSRPSASTTARAKSAASSRAPTAARPGSARCSRIRADRRRRHRDRRQQPERALRRAVGGVPHRIPDVERRPRQRHVQVHRRRRDLDRDHAQPRHAAGRGRPHRPGQHQGGFQPRLRARRERERRPVRVGRCRRVVEADQRNRARSASARSITRTSSATRATRTSSTCRTRRCSARPTAARRRRRSARTRTAIITTCGSIRTIRITSIDGNDGGGAITYDISVARPELERAGLPDRAVVSRDHHRAPAVPRLRLAAGQQHAVRAEQHQRAGRRLRRQSAGGAVPGRRRRARLHRAARRPTPTSSSAAPTTARS